MFSFKIKILKHIKIFIPNQDCKMVIMDMVGLAVSRLWCRHTCGPVGVGDFLL